MTKKVLTACSALIASILLFCLLIRSGTPRLTNGKDLSNYLGMSRPISNPKKSLLLKSELFENLSLHIDDVEFLSNAFVAQALVSPLVRFSNRGRYEPYVAKSWTQSGNSWSFHLHKGLTCEGGQVINAESFKKSLVRSLQ